MIMRRAFTEKLKSLWKMGSFISSPTIQEFVPLEKMENFGGIGEDIPRQLCGISMNSVSSTEFPMAENPGGADWKLSTGKVSTIADNRKI